MMNLGVAPGVTPVHGTRSTSAHAWLATALLAAVVLSVQASAVTVTGALVADDAGATPKLYHAAFIVAGALLLLRGRIARPRTELLLYFGITLGATLLAYAVYEPRVGVVKLLIALYIALVAGGVGRAAGASVVMRACRAASVVFLLLVVAKNVQHVPAFIAFLASPAGHPDVPSLAGGGLNLEATWLALSSILLIGTVVFVPYVLVAAATSTLYASRAGVVVAGVAILAALLHAWGGRRAALAAPAPGPPARHGWRRRMVTAAIAGAALGALGTGYLAARDLGNAAYVAQRFASIGQEPGSMGRLTLWRGGLVVFAEHPLGVGLGNAVPSLRRALGVDVPEDNLHNIYLQHAVEAGIPGLVALLVFGAMVLRRLVAARFRDHLLLFVAGYLVVGAIQFTGVDAMLWLAYGLQSGVSSGARLD